MGTYTLEQYRKVIKNRRAKLGKIDTPMKAAKYMQDTAKMLAPRYTGETINGIRARKVGKTNYQVESVVSPKGKTGFRQNLWANQTAPYRTPRMWWNKKKPTLYGSGSHKVTGLPRFWHFATLRTREKFREITRMKVKDILSTGV